VRAHGSWPLAYVHRAFVFVGVVEQHYSIAARDCRSRGVLKVAAQAAREHGNGRATPCTYGEAPPPGPGRGLLGEGLSRDGDESGEGDNQAEFMENSYRGLSR